MKHNLAEKLVQDPFLPPSDDQLLSIQNSICDQIGEKAIESLLRARPSPWMRIVDNSMGWAESGFHGHASNPHIIACFQHTSYHATSDQIPWCAAFVSAMLEGAGYKSAHSASAWDYIHYGSPSPLVRGAIVVLRFPGGGGHVTFCESIIDAHTFAGKGGNQGNTSRVSHFPRSAIVAIRWPK